MGCNCKIMWTFASDFRLHFFRSPWHIFIHLVSQAHPVCGSNCVTILTLPFINRVCHLASCCVSPLTVCHLVSHVLLYLLCVTLLPTCLLSHVSTCHLCVTPSLTCHCVTSVSSHPLQSVSPHVTLSPMCHLASWVSPSVMCHPISCVSPCLPYVTSSPICHPISHLMGLKYYATLFHVSCRVSCHLLCVMPSPVSCRLPCVMPSPVCQCRPLPQTYQAVLCIYPVDSCTFHCRMRQLPALEQQQLEIAAHTPLWTRQRSLNRIEKPVAWIDAGFSWYTADVLDKTRLSSMVYRAGRLGNPVAWAIPV